MNAKRSPIALTPVRTRRNRRVGSDPIVPPVVRTLPHAPLTGYDSEPHALVVQLTRSTGSPGHQAYFVKDMRGLVRIDPMDIQFVQADGDYVELHLEHRRIVLRNSLAEVLKTLPSDLMCQVNRSQAVNIRHLDLIGSDEVHIGELAFTLSKHFREPLLGSVRIIAGR